LKDRSQIMVTGRWIQTRDLGLNVKFSQHSQLGWSFVPGLATCSLRVCVGQSKWCYDRSALKIYVCTKIVDCMALYLVSRCQDALIRG